MLSTDYEKTIVLQCDIHSVISGHWIFGIGSELFYSFSEKKPNCRAILICTSAWCSESEQP